MVLEPLFSTAEFDLQAIRGLGAPFMEKLAAVYAAMDREYEKKAQLNGFACNGCEDSCCMTRFHHHTLSEFIYLLEGFSTLSPERQKNAQTRAEDVIQQYVEPAEHGRNQRIMCPLNVDGLCLRYAYRPMICRLHGIPHVLLRPDGATVQGTGCHEFEKQRTALNIEARLDRTPFYQQVAALEKSLRQQCRVTVKIKLTIAEMIVHFRR